MIPEATMTQPLVYICIATGEPMPNCLPAMQFRPDISYIVCSGSEDITEKADRMKAVLDYSGIPAVLIHDLPSSGYRQIHAFLFREIAGIRARHPDARLLVNITGGTKLMSLALHSLTITMPDTLIHYMDTAARRIEYLAPSDKAPEPLADNLLSARAILLLHGFNPIGITSEDDAWTAGAKKRGELTQLLGDNLGKGGIYTFINAMNRGYGRLCEEKDKQRSAALPLTIWLDFGGNLFDLVERCFAMAAKHGLLDFNPSLKKFRFLSEEAAYYLGGLWLEEFLWLKLKNDPELEVVVGVKGLWMPYLKHHPSGDPENNIHNEMDVLVIRQNIVHVVECKTGSFTRKNRSKETLEELSTLTKNSGGRLAKGYLATLHDLSQAELARAEQLNVGVSRPKTSKT